MIGKGSFGFVYKGTYGGKSVAIKCFKITTSEELENIKNEHQQLKNDYINLNSKYNILEQKQTGGNNDQNDILKLKKDIKNITSFH